MLEYRPRGHTNNVFMIESEIAILPNPRRENFVWIRFKGEELCRELRNFSPDMEKLAPFLMPYAVS